MERIDKLAIIILFSCLAMFSPSPAQAATPHPIQVRQTDSGGEFYNTTTGLKFVPRGNNYIRLNNINDPWNGIEFYHSLFDPGFYDQVAVESDFAKMQEDGYNLIRVFISDATVGSSSGGLTPIYMENVKDLLTRAKSHDLYVVITFHYLPKLGGYYTTNSNPENIAGDNWFYLSSEAIEGKKKFVTNFITTLLNQDAPTEQIFSYNIENEIYFDKSVPPLSLSSGTIKTPDGVTYNLAENNAKQQMMDSNLVYWINTIRQSIKQIDETALVAPGFFNPSAITGQDPRVTRSHFAIAEPESGGSMADYVDLHLYPGFHNLEADIATFEITNNKKPIVLGEFGAYKSNYPSTIDATNALIQTQTTTCRDHHFDGWITWTWDTSEQIEIYNALEQGESINKALAPKYRSNPCTIIDYAGDLNGDTFITLADYNMLIAGFGTTYTLKEYNLLVANFGK